MARFLQARVETQLALPRWIRSHRSSNHQTFPWPYRYTFFLSCYCVGEGLIGFFRMKVLFLRKMVKFGYLIFGGVEWL